jgi:hypothetical protein
LIENKEMKHPIFPMQIKIGFKKLFDTYRAKLDSQDTLMRDRAEAILKVADAYPILSEGMTSEKELETYGEQIDFILADLFSEVLQSNEIKMATIPFQEFIFKSTQRYKNILKVAGSDYKMSLTNFNEDQLFIMGCSIILNSYYGFRLDFRRPFYYDIPDANGIMRHYRVLYNADFMTVEKGENTKDITEEDLADLLDNFDNIAMWKEKFPPDSWISNGFVIANMYDATIDVSLSNFKVTLLQKDAKDESFAGQLQTTVRAVFNLPNLKLGYSIFNQEDHTFEQPPTILNATSYLLNGASSQACTAALCDYSYSVLFKQNKSFCVSDVERYHKMYPDNVVFKKLHDQKVGSAIITPIESDGVMHGILEIISPNARELNSINANKLDDILPFLADSVNRSKEMAENEMELLIQQECTSIHSSVHWKFKQEARRVLKKQMQGEEASFQEVVFENVYPLFGQIDIKGSSHARNVATQDDLILQLQHVKKIINKIYKIESLPIYEQINFRIENFLNDLEANLQVDSERRVLNFLRNEIVPLYDHLSSKNETLKALIDKYYKLLDADKGFIYKHRKDYDDSVMRINKTLATILDKKQWAAQQMYPHYYERFKTDGVEHNLYIGESITKNDSFNKIYLYNLRLWQLQAMCEMENSFYRLKEKLPVPLDVASMILAFNGSLSLRFRMDEKRFDVDGTYNARYEVVKKRVDKAHIKGTDERITQPGKITIIYSQKIDESDYLKYIHFLQSKKYLGSQVELLELEDLQGVTGLRAIRVNVLYNRGEKDKEYYTYDDLMQELNP